MSGTALAQGSATYRVRALGDPFLAQGTATSLFVIRTR